MIIITIRDDLGSSLEMRLDNKHTGGVRHRPANTFENTFGFRGGSSARASRVCPGSPRCLFTVCVPAPPGVFLPVVCPG